jgi:hypothetical protein
MPKVRSLLDRYASGEFDGSIKFTETIYKDHYKDHLAWANHWSDLDPDEIRQVREDMFHAVL